MRPIKRRSAYYYCGNCGHVYDRVYYLDFDEKTYKDHLFRSRFDGSQYFLCGWIDLVGEKPWKIDLSEEEPKRGPWKLEQGKDQPTTCPICGDSLYSVLDNESMSKDPDENEIINFERKTIEQKVHDFIMDAEIEATQNLLSDQALPPASLKLNVKTYLQHLITIEKDILYLSRRLFVLMLAHKQTCQPIIRRQIDEREMAESMRTEELRQIKEEIVSLADKYPVLSEAIDYSDVGIKKPDKPTYKRYNIFTKRKIKRENDLMLQEYTLQMETFEKEFERLKSEELLRRKAVNEENREKLKTENDRLTARYQECKNAPLKWGDDLDGLRQLSENYASEISEAKKKIQELCVARAKYHTGNVIHPKYWDLVAITTIYEYITTGRCSSLTGADGAYNLYESEIRVNHIIGQLDKINISLDQIRSNQYYTYTLLNDMNAEIKGLSHQLSDIVQNTAQIADNSAYIAYNSEKIARYSKINNELTNALGYLIPSRKWLI